MLRARARGIQAVVIALAGSGAARAQPVFTVEPGGPSGLIASGLYSSAGGSPVLVGGIGGMGLTANDSLNSVSRRHGDTKFIVCVSVDPTSVGATQAAPPAGLPPYNVHDQATKNQSAGDIFAGSKAYDRATGLMPGASMSQNENYLMVNQSAPYPVNLGLLPMAGPNVTVPTGTPQDHVRGVLDLDRTTSRGGLSRCISRSHRGARRWGRSGGRAGQMCSLIRIRRWAATSRCSRRLGSSASCRET